MPGRSPGTEVLPDHLARQVEDQLLGAARDAPWDGLSPRAWRKRIDRAVVRVDIEAARKRSEQAYEERNVRSMPSIGGMADLHVSARAEDVAMVEQVLTDQAHGRPATGADGQHVSMDQRRVGCVCRLVPRVRDGAGCRGAGARASGRSGLSCTPTPSSVTARQPTTRGTSADAGQRQRGGPDHRPGTGQGSGPHQRERRTIRRRDGRAGPCGAGTQGAGREGGPDSCWTRRSRPASTRFRR